MGIDMNDTDTRYFASPQEAVNIITELLGQSDWKTLASYYDLSGSGIDREELESGRFFIRQERPEAAHPAGFWRNRHPFAPGFEYLFQTKAGESTVLVHVHIEIDEGGGMTQEGRHAFKMRKTPSGYQVLPETVSAF